MKQEICDGGRLSREELGNSNIDKSTEPIRQAFAMFRNLYVDREHRVFFRAQQIWQQPKDEIVSAD